MKRILALLASLVLVSSASAANFCSDSVVDETGVLNSGGIQKVTQGINELVRQGMDVRVRVLNDLKGSSSLELLKDSLLQKCGSWKGSSGGMKNNLVVMMVVPSQGMTGFFYGDALRAKLDSKQLQIQSGMNSKFRDHDFAGGLVAGLSDSADMMSLKMSQQEAGVVINKPADLSGITNVFGWIIALIAVCVFAWVGWLVFRQKEARRNAMREALTEQGRCTAIINGFETPYAVLMARIKQSTISEMRRANLTGRLKTVNTSFGAASSSFDAINRSQNDPSKPNLSVEEYNGIAVAFRKTAESLEAIVNNFETIARDLEKPEEVQKPDMGQPTKSSKQAAQAPVRHDAPYKAPHASASVTGREASHPIPSAPAPAPIQPIVEHHTTVINNGGNNDGLLTGILLGEMMGDHHHHRDDNDGYRDSRPMTPSSPRYSPPPAPIADAGSETTWGKSSSGGGSETTFGESSRGGGNESRFGGGDFGSKREEVSPPPSAPADCRPTDCDCKSSDCAAADCSKSDCAASDCNCDCTSSDT